MGGMAKGYRLEKELMGLDKSLWEFFFFGGGGGWVGTVANDY